MRVRAHGELSAREVGELVGVSGTTIGQWARRGLIRSSQSEGEPRVYGVEDVGEAAVVAELLSRGVKHKAIHAAIARLRDGGRAWPLSDAWLATTDEPRPRIVLRDESAAYALDPRGWQRLALPPPLREVRVRLRRAA
ncbi:MAG TPA: MerR family transcriptional regulator [Capillimicrobium sp.]|nr:MerR family transcriptional regulator [Capillimicrobium sp.]